MADKNIEQDISDLSERVVRLETNIKIIKKQVENDIPHELAVHRTILETLQRRSGDMDAVSRFLSLVLKAVATILAIIWSVKNLFGGK